MVNEVNNKELFNHFSKGNLKLGEIRNYLLGKGFAESELDDLIKLYISERNGVRTLRGIYSMLTGGAFLLTSMALTFFNVLPQMRGFILFGLTGIGICIVVVGLYLLFEKENIS